jgi:hypothetical protein
VAGLLVAAFAAIVLATGLPAHAAFTDRGLDACHGRPVFGDECGSLVTRFQDDFWHPMSSFVDLGMLFLPALVGMFIGAPLLAREFEQGTWQLAWGQAVPRLRWLVVKLTLVLAAVAIFAAAVSGLFMWWHQPHDGFDTRLNPTYFAYALPVFVAYTVFAVALGAAAGRFIRRTLPAMAVVLLVFLAVRIPFDFGVREMLQDPITTFVPFGEAYTEADAEGHYVVSDRIVDRDGNPVSESAILEIEAEAGPDNAGVAEGEFRRQGLRQEVTYHPAASFWTFQLIEAGIFLGMSAALVTFLVWLVNRRPI